MHWPTVSVIITSLNRAAWIERTILSVLRQNYPADVQVIVSDGGSNDGTIEILKRYPQITWWSKEDAGIVDAINKGLTVAAGEFVAIQDSDNFYLPDAFKLTLVTACERPDFDIFTGCDVFLDPDGQTCVCSQLDDHEITPRSLLLRRVIPIHCAFIRRNVIDAVGGFRDFSHLHDARGGNVGNVGIDIDFWYRALHFHRARFVPHHTAVYQKHAEMMSANSKCWLANMTGMVKRCEADERYSSRFRLSAQEKRDVYICWEIQQERINGNEARVNELVEQVMSEGTFSDEARRYLALHAFVDDAISRPRRPHPNYRVPDLHWYHAKAA